MLTQEEIKKIRILFLEGKQKKTIASIMKCSEPTVAKYVKDLDKKESLIGKKFGKLTVLDIAPKDPTLASRCIRYKCKCDCGKEIIVNSGSLRSGHTKSCGCSRRGNFINLTGQTFGLLTVIKPTDLRRENRVGWLCKCKCGKEMIAFSSDLLRGDVKSCGCLKRSYGEIKIEELLKKMNIEYKTQYKIEECKNKRALPFDFAIFDNNQLLCLIEYQGDVHFISTGGWNTEEKLKERQKRDEIKRIFCKENNIKLIEILYTQLDDVDEAFLREKIYG